MEPYFVDAYTWHELQRNLNALRKNGYEIVSVLPKGVHHDEPLFIVIARLS